MKMKVLRSDALSVATTKHKYNTKNEDTCGLVCSYCVMGSLQDQIDF